MTRPFKYEWHWALVEAKGLTPTTKLVALALWDYSQADGSNAHPGNSKLAVRLGITPRAVQGCLERLRDAGWITRTARPGDRRRRLADVYRLTYPSAGADFDHLDDGTPERGFA